MRAKYLLVHIPYSVTYGELQLRALRAFFVTNKLVSSWPGPPIMNYEAHKNRNSTALVTDTGFSQAQYLAALHPPENRTQKTV
jgi:hypothetical protein